MKELSVEQKAKAYDEGILKLRGMMPNWERLSYNGKTFLQDLVYIFPELKESEESEDERIRKDIVTYLKSILSNKKYGDKFIESWIAWLEKQGEKGTNGNEREIPISEQNLTGKSEYINDMGGNGCYLKNTTQASAWSEEDEEAINLACSILYSNFNENENFDKNQMCIGEIIEKLKSLKDRVISQPKQEWSEEDNRILHAIRNALNYEKPRNYLKSRDLEFLEVLDWLKSLRPQSRWKPSEEMLEALHKTIPENVMEISEDEMLLNKLYQGLKYGRVLSRN